MIFFQSEKTENERPAKFISTNRVFSFLFENSRGHAHTDCNSPLAALYETLISNDNFKSALPLTILADLPFCVVCNRMALSKCGALSISGLIIIAGFTRYTFLMSNY